MPKHLPPMYNRVANSRAKKSSKFAVDPEQLKAILANTPKEEAPSEPPVKAEPPKKAKAVSKKVKKKPSKKKAVKKKPKLEWDRTMTRAELFDLAKGAGLEVRTRDLKEDLIDAIKKANRSRK